MKLFNKIRSVDEIVATFDKTLSELEARIAHDNEQVAQVAADRQAAEEEHQRKLAELATKESNHTESATRAGRIADKIRKLLD
ncbi:hypothetical protein [Klebsiella phage phiKp_4]|jgi:hypothetical protein|uniref:Uncharacterized protein n=2 Tax=Slopekvirus TaxID=1985328 RepID=A0A0K1LPX5_9CAUD|nr:hypothetical protein CPT_Matisse278 [Klebsiella phage Matisse]YP_010089183.1 hypothetical protein KNT56_gp076 [Escherichia phage phT4A]UJP30422.1 hypothetical protein phKl59_65 [Raoultella phage Rpl1]UQJ94911.1 hypothetical protein IANJMKHF_00005 [Klebsiella phage CPRSA]UQJ95399.1 hypothetical protein ALHIDCOG_00011 [Klebsiella phage CPRSB]UYL05696.1 hypothetical protein PMMJPKLI_00156 [Klebsiella phage KP13MC5-1]WDQ26275.1 hypothetical protein phiKPNS3_00008 [Klebsiella phage phi_KPN_S3]